MYDLWTRRHLIDCKTIISVLMTCYLNTLDFWSIDALVLGHSDHLKIVSENL
jgi:hypothetical protein